MRERSTWNREVVKNASHKRADIYTMNQEHPQPAFDAYVTGDPSTFAEDVHEPNTWESEYANGTTKRDEIGMPEFRKDTWDHSEKTASEAYLLKKADLCVAVAELMLAGKKVAASGVEDQAVALMYLPAEELLATHTRLAAEQEEEEEVEVEDDDGEEQQAQQKSEQQAQQKQAEQQQEGDDAKDDAPEQQHKQAQQQSEQDADESDDKQAKQAADEGEEKSEKSTGDQNAKANNNWPVDKKAAQQMASLMSKLSASIKAGDMAGVQSSITELSKAAQMEPVATHNLEAQIQQMVQTAIQQQMAPVAAPVQTAGQELDMLMADDCHDEVMADEIMLEPSPMDVGMDDLGGDDAVLRSLFAADEDQGEEMPEEEQHKQARTAGRTVGTRPTAGVSRLGGSTKTAGTSNVDNLSSLWATAPDVRSAFGLK